MKLLLDFLPIVLFFGVFKFAEGRPEAAAAFATEHLGFLVSGGVVGPEVAPVLLATLVVIAATLAQVGWLLLRRRRVDAMLWISLALVVVLGGATVWFHSETFIKWKPTALYGAMAGALLAGRLFGRNLLRTLLGEQLVLPDAVWTKLLFAWIAFFAFMGVANIVVAYRFPTDVWVDFKLFGGIGLMLLFTIAQGFWLSPYLKDEDDAAAARGAPGGKP